MEKDLVDGKIGANGSYDVEFKGGKLSASVSYDLKGVEGTLKLAIGAEAVLLALKEAIPGHFEDSAIDAAIALLKA